jgi:hypothetical protein
MTRPRTSDVRRAIPVAVENVVLRRTVLELMGLPTNTRLDLDHMPALALRMWDPNAGDFIPGQHDPNFIMVLTKAGHRAKTSGRKGEKRSTSYGSDVHAIAKLDRLTPTQKDFQRKVLRRPCGKKRERTGNWPKGRKIRSRNDLRGRR